MNEELRQLWKEVEGLAEEVLHMNEQIVAASPAIRVSARDYEQTVQLLRIAHASFDNFTRRIRSCASWLENE